MRHLAHLVNLKKRLKTYFIATTDIDKIDRPITTDITTRSQPANT